MIIKIENGVAVGNPIHEENFRQLFPETSFPRILQPQVVESFGYGMYEFSQIPTAGRYEKVVELPAKKDYLGFWRQAWTVVPKTLEEKQAEDQEQADKVRMQRDRILYASDWSQLPDAPITTEQKQEWLLYRQELRDVPNQQGFPWNVVWPAEPKK